jgi:hypothetical protein
VSPKSKLDIPDSKPNPPTVEQKTPTVKPDPPTFEPDTPAVEPNGDMQMSDLSDDTLHHDTINENDFEVKGATIEKDDEATLNDGFSDEAIETPDGTKKRKKQEAGDEKHRLRTLFGSK